MYVYVDGGWNGVKNWLTFSGISRLLSLVVVCIVVFNLQFVLLRFARLCAPRIVSMIFPLFVKGDV